MLQNKLYTPIYDVIEKRETTGEPTILAIDGPCGTGKTILSQILAERYDCNIFHMDDFFLPMERKTKERLAEPGGNVDYERFHSEVLSPLITGETVQYRPFDCKVGQIREAQLIVPKKLNIIEGVYSLHPTLQKFYDWKVFLTVNPEVQLERIKARNGEDKLQMFIERWIPLENHYFNELKIVEMCDTVIDTSKI